jgi:aryl-alcohol dehydrogenase-like predicted oxidoreductase
MSDFIIGTANFTQAYGSSNMPLDKSEVIAILESALMSGINELDTAESYGRLESIIPKSILSEFIVRTKFVVTSDTVVEKICHSIQDKFKNVKAVLIHNAEDLSLDILGENLEKMKSYLNDISVGVSIYNNVDILKLNCIKSVQLPHNILNRPLDMVSSEILNDIEVIVRSIFLQGVLLKERKSENFHFAFIREKINSIAKNYNINPSLFLLSLVKSQNLKPVLGFRNLSQFQQIRSSYESLPQIDKHYHISTKPTIYDPRLWKIK